MQTEFEVVVIGGGPAGMMAAARASARGRQVLLLEKNHVLGKKLAITGGGRCNVTNNKPVVREMLSQYKDSGKFLFSTFMQHGVRESVDWFNERGINFVEENEGRLFPDTHKAETIRETLVNELKQQGVIIEYDEAVQSINKDKKTGQFLIKTSHHTWSAESCVVATGGTSRPETGSTGEGFIWLKHLGHTVVANNMALVPLTIRNSWISHLSGITLPTVKIAVYVDGKKQVVKSGKLLFTHVGITGPTILNLSQSIGDWLAHSPVTLKVDLVPDLDAGELKIKFYELLANSSNKKIKNVLVDLVPTALGTVLLEELGIDGETPSHSVTKPERTQLLKILKALELEVKGLLGSDKAVVSAGGVALEEVDFKTMESKLISGLYLVGDVLNINRPSGGYSLQLCWSTGSVAGDNA